MIPLRHVRRMSHLACKFTGKGDAHVVDPIVDMRFVFEESHSEAIRRSLEERQSKIDFNQVGKDYLEWWKQYETWTRALKESKEAGIEAKKQLRAAANGLLAALNLPNTVHAVGKKEKEMLKKSSHAQYLAQQGLMRIDKDNEVVHLLGYPVLLQRNVRGQLLDMFANATLVSPSCFARAAVLEAVNVPLQDFLSFTDGSQTFPLTHLVGCSLPSLVSLFIRAEFSTKTNEWPITLQASGAGYHQKRGTTDLCYSRQRLKHSVLSLSLDEAHMDGFIADAVDKLAALLDEGLLLDVKARVVRGKELKNYESQAIVFEDKGLELARISRIGEYISRRLNITTESEAHPFVQMAYVETDVDRILARLVDGLIEGKEAPKSLRDAVRSTST